MFFKKYELLMVFSFLVGKVRSPESGGSSSLELLMSVELHNSLNLQGKDHLSSAACM